MMLKRMALGVTLLGWFFMAVSPSGTPYKFTFTSSDDCEFARASVANAGVRTSSCRQE